jgi:hypothetical protein
MHSRRWLVVLSAATWLVPRVSTVAQNQDSPSAPPPAAATPSGTTPPAATPANRTGTSSSKRKYSHANDFLIRGTVFTNQALAFPFAQLRIRRTTEKKFRWQSSTNSRGEFAVRVPQGLEYEMVVHAKGFADQTKTIDAKNGLSEGQLIFRMEPAAGGKK